MKTKKQNKKELHLSKFVIKKKEALQLEGGPETDRGTVTVPAKLVKPTA
ncbi:hypothetical protein [Tenacibaculum sp. SZ-18]|nr:hypothetical protein [Tenacibaculum sp. SZ-18]